MTKASARRGFVARPSNPDDWIKSTEPGSPGPASSTGFTARLTIDVTPEGRGRIKIAAFQRGVTVADMLRELLAREFPQSPGDPS